MCGNNLYNLRGDKYPECGQELKLQIALMQPRLAAFSTGMIGIASGLGFSTFVLMWGVISYIARGGPQRWQLLLLLVETVILGLLLAAWIRLSKRIRTQSLPIQFMLAAGAWVVSIVAAAVFIAAAR